MSTLNDKSAALYKMINKIIKHVHDVRLIEETSFSTGEHEQTRFSQKL